MLETSQKLLTKGFHPAAISDSLLHFSAKAVDVLESMAIPVDLTDNASLLKSANTALNSKYRPVHLYVMGRYGTTYHHVHWCGIHSE
ncbi:T-complex protein 1 subunit delta [Portunus trituberculatus]|uniref:T-complex protein 1 subunit delta n=1 Tax=Portunus trituberculatus TaxID=210409 RepID=A0A5B7INE4_PORTR|nr:T-complex protein 1 subunit delta [Portunus trituberculatus]